MGKITRLTHIFQMGWNHQLHYFWLLVEKDPQTIEIPSPSSHTLWVLRCWNPTKKHLLSRSPSCFQPLAEEIFCHVDEKWTCWMDRDLAADGNFSPSVAATLQQRPTLDAKKRVGQRVRRLLWSRHSGWSYDPGCCVRRWRRIRWIWPKTSGARICRGRGVLSKLDVDVRAASKHLLTTRYNWSRWLWENPIIHLREVWIGVLSHLQNPTQYQL